MNSPINKVLLELDKLYTDEIITAGGLKLYLDPSYRPEWNVTVSGTIAGLPRDGIAGLEVGDRVFFSYHVVNEKTWEDDRSFFVRNLDGNEFVREYTDKMGGTIKVVAFPGVITKRWAGAYVDEFGVFIDGCQGSESDVERWMSQFKFGYSKDLLYKNLVESNGMDYWLADTDMIYAVKRKKNIEATPGYAICKPLVLDLTDQVNLQNGLSLPVMSVKGRLEDRARIISMGEKLQNATTVSANTGDIVFFQEKYVERYDFDGNQYYVVKHSRILAKV